MQNDKSRFKIIIHGVKTQNPKVKCQQSQMSTSQLKVKADLKT